MNMKFELEDDHWWTAKITLTSWKGFQGRIDACDSRDSLKLSDKVKLVFAPEGRGINLVAYGTLSMI